MEIVNISRIISGIIQKYISYRSFFGYKSFVLMFHEVTNGERPVHPELSIEKDVFCSLLEIIELAGYNFCSPEELIAGVERKILLSFDDIWENAVINGIDHLRKNNIPYIAFITSSLVGKTGYLTERQMNELVKDPLCSVGFHSKAHIPMRDLKSSMLIDEAISSTDFDKYYNVKCQYFAYPYGSVYMCPKHVIDIVSKSHYRAAFSTIYAPIGARVMQKYPFFIPRISVSDKGVKRIISML